jgi:hypothetical protein
VAQIVRAIAAQFKVLLDTEYKAMDQVVKNLGLVRK